MSSVNQVSKNNVIYDLNDKRVVVVDLGNIDALVSEGSFQKSVSNADIQSLYNAEVGIVKFLYQSTEAKCRVTAKSQREGTTMILASLMLQMGEDQYTAMGVQGITDGTNAQVNGTIINQEISGGGSGGDGVPVIEFDNVEYQYYDGYYMAGVIPTEQQYNTALNNDVVVIKVIDDNGEIMVFTKTMVQEEGGEASIVFGSFNPEEVGMAYIVKADDGEGGYIYQGMLMKGSMPSGDTTLYTHDITLSGFVINGMTLEATLKVISKESSTYNSMQDVLNSYIYNGITSMVLQLGMDIPGDNETIHQEITTPALGFLNISGSESVKNLEFIMEGSITDIDINDLTITQDYVNTL